MVISTFGLRFGVRTNAPEVWPRIVGRLPVGSQPLPERTAPHVYSLWAGPPPERRGLQPMSLLYRNSARLARTAELGAVLGRFETDLRNSAATWSPRHTFLRAAGVRVGDQAVVVASTAGRREDPLVAELLRQGAAAFARDFAPLDRLGRLVVNLSRRSIGGQAAAVTIGALPIRLVVLPAAVETGPARLERLGRALATVALASTAVTVAATPDAQLEALAAVARRAVVVRLFYSDPLPAAEEVLRLAAPRLAGP